MNIPSPVVRKRARIEIIPLIDIIFFLLATFVMVSLSMVKNQGIHVNLPSAATSAPNEQKKNVTITVTENGIFYFNKEEMTLNNLLSRLKSLKNDNSEVGVIINGDEKALFGDAVNILDEVRRMGIAKVTIQTKSKTASAGESGQ
ncbi:MAG: biopolymer transporter ExbD [Candidatus Omnitrophica bacterium]|nr:biopolymer transporter ExbD [Candidatus Omnitrophota bacterium]